MSVSYIMTLEQLSVLAHFASIEGFPDLPPLPMIDRERGQQLAVELGEQGMLHLHGCEASVDISLGFALRVIASPMFVIKALNGVAGYCSEELGVAVSPHPRAPNKFRITPLPNAWELAARIWESYPDQAHADISIRRKGQPWVKATMTLSELEKAISQIFTEVSP